MVHSNKNKQSRRQWKLGKCIFMYDRAYDIYHSRFVSAQKLFLRQSFSKKWTENESYLDTSSQFLLVVTFLDSWRPSLTTWCAEFGNIVFYVYIAKYCNVILYKLLENNTLCLRPAVNFINIFLRAFFCTNVVSEAFSVCT